MKRQYVMELSSLALGACMLIALPRVHAASNTTNAAGATPAKPLSFDESLYTKLTVDIDGKSVPVRWYKEICYVSKPVAVASTQTPGAGNGPATPVENPCGYQGMNIYVPESAAEDQQTAIYFAVSNSGWFASYVRAGVTDGAKLDSATSNVGAALKAGYIFIDVGTRSRGLAAADGTQAGKAPAVVVDAKAAVRYLRLNDAAMPGSAERIIVNGTSGGGGLSVALGASGNSPDYLPYLAAIGAAGIDRSGHSTLRDDVFAVNAYCPITDLGNADVIYEWLFATLGTRKTVGSDPDPKGSAELAAQFPAYEKSLRLKNPDGMPLTADNMMATVQQEVTRSAEAFMMAGGTIPDLGQDMPYTSGGGRGAAAVTHNYKNDWIHVDNAAKKVVSINIERYLAYLATQNTPKGTPSFDQRGISTVKGGGAAESTLFGTPDQPYANFTAFSWNHNDVKGDGNGRDDTGLDWDAFLRTSKVHIDQQVKLLNPMAYIGTKADTAPYWYVRHGTRDRDTASIVSINLSRALAADPKVKDVNYRLAWDRPHSGNYDVPEAMEWIAKSLQAAKTGAKR